MTSFNYNINVAVIGASGGIGGAIANTIETNLEGSRVFRLSRSHLSNRASERCFHLDLENETTIRSSAAKIARLAAELHIIIVATGILHEGENLLPEKSWSALSYDSLERVFRINTIGPALVAKHFLPLLAKDRKTVFAALSARVGSIDDNRLGGWYGYRASKAALNMIIKSLSIELARRRPLAICVGLHPGTVDTALSQPYKRGVTKGSVFTPKRAAENLLQVLETLKPTDSGGLIAWDGSQVPS